MKKALTASVVLHLALIFGVLGMPKGCAGDKDADERGSAVPTEVVKFEPKPDEREFEVTIKFEKGPGDVKKARKKCTGLTYGGIGVTTMWASSSSSFTVEQVAPGYVGESIGLKTGDHVEAKEPIKGKAGTPVTLTVVTPSGDRRTLTVVRDEICYNTERIEP